MWSSGTPCSERSATPRYTSGANRSLSATSRSQSFRRASLWRKSTKPNCTGLRSLNARSPTKNRVETWVSTTRAGVGTAHRGGGGDVGPLSRSTTGASEHATTALLEVGAQRPLWAHVGMLHRGKGPIVNRESGGTEIGTSGPMAPASTSEHCRDGQFRCHDGRLRRCDSTSGSCGAGWRGRRPPTFFRPFLERWSSILTFDEQATSSPKHDRCRAERSQVPADMARL